MERRLRQLSGSAAAVVAMSSAFIATGWAMAIDGTGRTGSQYLAGAAWLLAIVVLAVTTPDA